MRTLFLQGAGLLRYRRRHLGKPEKLSPPRPIARYCGHTPHKPGLRREPDDRLRGGGTRPGRRDDGAAQVRGGRPPVPVLGLQRWGGGPGTGIPANRGGGTSRPYPSTTGLVRQGGLAATLPQQVPGGDSALRLALFRPAPRAHCATGIAALAARVRGWVVSYGGAVDETFLTGSGYSSLQECEA